MKNILIAGATGYLGNYVLKEFKAQGYFSRVIVRNIKQHKKIEANADDIIIANLTEKEALKGVCDGIDIVFSSVGITKQKDGFTYMDVDYKANLNLLEESVKSGVKKFVYVSIYNGNNLKNLKICAAREKFVEALKASGLEYCVIRPTGYFSDMKEFFDMANKGKIILFGNGINAMNPIEGQDLAKVCVNAAISNSTEVCVGGPEYLTYNEIAKIAFSVANKPEKLLHVPFWISRFVLFLLRSLTSSKFYGPIEFFITILSINMKAPKYGKHTLKEYYEGLKKADSPV